jgi:hypothetical protein
MKTLSIFVLMMAVCGQALGVIYPANQQWSANLTRSGFPAPGAANVLSCITDGSETTGTLIMPAQYMVVCAGDVFLRWGTAAAELTTDLTTDFRLPADTIFTFATGGGDAIQQMGCDAAATTACTVLEMK